MEVIILGGTEERRAPDCCSRPRILNNSSDPSSFLRTTRKAKGRTKSLIHTLGMMETVSAVFSPEQKARKLRVVLWKQLRAAAQYGENSDWSQNTRLKLSSTQTSSQESGHP